ncbi:MAG: MMPL family transporter, partial [Gaiellaceae bacterium]
MSPLKRSNNIAARMGRWSADHWKTAVFGWLAFVVAAVMLGTVVGTKSLDDADANVGQSKKAEQILEKSFPQADAQTELVFIQSRRHLADHPEFRGVVDEVVAAVRGNREIKNLKDPLAPGNHEQITKDRHAVMVTWDMKGDYDHAKTKIDAIEAAVAKIAADHPGYYVGEAGAISSGKALDKMFNDQLKRAGELSIPITFIILLLVFGALVAVGVPLLLALSGVLATIGLVALPSHIVPMDQNVSAVVLLIGLAVGVDYTLFYLKREREERAAGRSARAALEAAAATSGRSVLISGITVMIAMAGMLFSGDKTYLGFGVATMMVVGVAMLGSLTVLPALLAKLGDRVDKGKIPFVHRLARRSGGGRFWTRVLTPVLRRPGISAALAAGVLIVLATPVLFMH